MNFHHQNEMKSKSNYIQPELITSLTFVDDPLKPAYVVGFKIFQNKFLKPVLKLLFFILPLILVIEICIFASSPMVFDLAKNGLILMQISHVRNTIFAHSLNLCRCFLDHVHYIRTFISKRLD